ncbi:MAG: nicotinate phosphoribosyltransferase [Verrucomicrobiota bacterium]|nr:nicotinate phosphoribosyltransferase [Limisphaera sp.]MDW8382733.1 nicotinate phosphoribosyltransferase [Verrucomicrobiota bacterium]
MDATDRAWTALLTDLYQLTMAQGFWKAGRATEEAVYHLYFRENPFGGGFALACGLADAVQYLEGWRFEEGDLTYLAGLNVSERPLFEPAFLRYLRDLRFECDLDAVPEGTVVFPHEPLVRVQGPILQAQLVETALLYWINYQTLIATKAARICLAAGNAPVWEFGLRRAQGGEGGLAAARAAYVGGCAGTSNVWAGRKWGIPVRGTMAHGWVMAFESELEAFQAYAEAMPHNCVLLVDTYDTLAGVQHAIEVGRQLRQRGFDLSGIRLDSGDLTWLSQQARRMLDEAGFTETKILASNDLDEYQIARLRQEGACIDAWGVGTRLVTGWEQPALGGVYKLSAVRSPDGRWCPRLKVSESAAKTSTPGRLQVRRFERDGRFVADAIYDLDAPLPEDWIIVDPAEATRRKRISRNLAGQDLLKPVLRGGRRVCEWPTLEEIREHARQQLERLDRAVLRLTQPYAYPAGLEVGLHDRKMSLILAAREQGGLLGRPGSAS